MNVIDQKFQVDHMLAVRPGLRDHVALVIDIKVTRAPTVDVIMFSGFFDGPFWHVRVSRGKRFTAWRTI